MSVSVCTIPKFDSPHCFKRYYVIVSLWAAAVLEPPPQPSTNCKVPTKHLSCCFIVCQVTTWVLAFQALACGCMVGMCIIHLIYCCTVFSTVLFLYCVCDCTTVACLLSLHLLCPSKWTDRFTGLPHAWPDLMPLDSVLRIRIQNCTKC